MRSTLYGSGGQLVARPHLESRLDPAHGRAVCLVWGPPGSGKHTLVETVLARGGRSVWRARPEPSGGGAKGSSLRGFRITESPDPGPFEEVSKFVEHWRNSPREGILYLDGFDLAPADWKSALPPDLLVAPPAGLRLILLARGRPRLPVEKLRLSGWLEEIGPDDLRMDRSETFRLVEATGLTRLPAEGTASIHETARGWIAGTLLCALHRRASSDPERAATRPGENSRLREYLIQEILADLPESLGSSLLDLSVLRDPPSALCEDVFERTDTAAVLAEISERLPLLSRNEDGNWHLHPLAAAGLSAILRERDPERHRSLHRRAGRWCLSRARAEDAVVHALEARDPELLESVAERALQNLFRNSEFFALQRHVRDLPPSLARDRPFLSLFLAWALFHMGREKEGEAHLDRVRGLASALPRGETLFAHEAFLRSILLRLEGSSRASLETAGEAFVSCRGRHPFLAASLRVQMAVGRFLSGDLEGSRSDLEDAMDRAGAAEHHLAYFGSGYTLVEIHVLRGRIDLAHRALSEQRRHAETGSAKGRPVSGYLEIARSRLSLLEGNLAEACESAERGILLGRRCDNIRILNYGLAARAEIAALSGDLDGAARALDEAEAVSRRTRMHWAVDFDDLEAKRMRLLLPRLGSSVLHAWLARALPDLERPSLPRLDALRTALHILPCLGRAPEALELGRAWKPYLEREGLLLPLLRTEYAMALASGFLGRRSRAVEHMDTSLRLAARMGLAGPYLHGPELDGIRREVLTDWGRSGKEDAATIALANRLAGAEAAAPAEARAASVLSEREAEVLRAIREGRSNKEIAEALFVAESTVKTHLKNIFAKLKVTNRTRAVALATEARMI